MAQINSKDIDYYKTLYPRYTWVFDLKDTGISIHNCITAWINQIYRQEEPYPVEKFIKTCLTVIVKENDALVTICVNEPNLNKICIRSDFMEEGIVIPFNKLIRVHKNFIEDLNNFPLEEDTSYEKISKVFSNKKQKGSRVAHIYEDETSIFIDVYYALKKETYKFKK